MTTEQAGDRQPNAWEEIGQATEDFARRVARDAGKFAERLQEHASEFERDVTGRRRRTQRHRRHGCRQSAPATDVRRVFEDIRTLLTDVLDGIDALVGHVFPDADTPPDGAWVRIVTNRAVTCVACGRGIGTGEESDTRRLPEGTAFRCLACGPQASQGQPPGSPAPPAN